MPSLSIRSASHTPSHPIAHAAESDKHAASTGSEAFKTYVQHHQPTFLHALQTLMGQKMPLKRALHLLLNANLSAQLKLPRSLEGALLMDKITAPMANNIERQLMGYYQGAEQVNEDMREATAIFDAYFDSEAANKAIAAMPEKKRKAVEYAKNVLGTFLRGGTPDPRLNKAFLTKMPGLLAQFERLADFMDSPEDIRPVNWNEIIPGTARTRGEERALILAEFDAYPDVRKDLEKYFDKLDSFFSGKLKRAPKLLLIGEPGTGKTELLERIRIMLGFSHLTMNQDDLSIERNIVGQKSSFFDGLGMVNSMALGMLPSAVIEASEKNLTVRLDDLKWKDYISETDKVPRKGIKNLPWAKKFLHPKTDSIPINWFHDLQEEDAPEISVKDMIVLMSSNDPIPSDLGMRETVTTISMPSLSPEKKIAWTHAPTAKSYRLPSRVWEAAQSYLPFIAEADTYYIVPPRPGVRDTQAAYRRVLSLLLTHPEMSEKEMKREILKSLSGNEETSFRQVEDAQEKIDRRHEQLIDRKIRWVRSELTSRKDLEDRHKEQAEKYLSFVAEKDTTQFQRTAAEMKGGLESLIAVLKNRPEDPDFPIDAAILNEMGKGYPLFPHSPLPDELDDQTPAEKIDQSIRDFPLQLKALYGQLNAEYAQTMDSTVNTMTKTIVDTLGGHAMISLAVWMAISDFFPDYAESTWTAPPMRAMVEEVVGLILNKLEGTKINYANAGSRENEESTARSLKKLKYMYDNLLNSEVANRYMDSIGDPGLRAAILCMKKAVLEASEGKAWHYILSPKEWPKFFPRFLSLFKIPTFVRKIDWTSNIPETDETRQQGKDALLKRYPELRTELEIFFNDLDLLVQGKLKCQVRLVLVGGSQNKIDNIFDEIERITGLGTITLESKDLCDPDALFGKPFSAIALDEKMWEGQKLPLQILSQPSKNFFLRANGINWNVIGNNDTALKFLDPDPLRMEEPLRCFRMMGQKDASAPVMDRSMMILLLGAPEDIPAAHHALKSRITTTLNPPMATESAIEQAELHAGEKIADASAETTPEMQKEMQEAWKSARKFLPFLVWADIHWVQKGGGDSIARIYMDLIDSLAGSVDHEEEAVKKGIVRDLHSDVATGSLPSLEDVETAIFEKKIQIAAHKRKLAEDELRSDETLSEDVRSRILEQLDFVAGMDTHVLHRSGMEKMRAALKAAIAALREDPGLDAEKMRVEVLVHQLMKDIPEDLQDSLLGLANKSLVPSASA